MLGLSGLVVAVSVAAKALLIAAKRMGLLLLLSTVKAVVAVVVGTVEGVGRV